MFFFFKQKTADGFRIWDWSSDVCSSDLLGARVIATAGSNDKTKAARAHGADLVINYRKEDFRDRVLEATGGRGADVVFDPVGGAVFDTSLRCLAPDEIGRASCGERVC